MEFQPNLIIKLRVMIDSIQVVDLWFFIENPNCIIPPLHKSY